MASWLTSSVFRPQSVESHPHLDDVDNRLEALRAMGYRVKPWREGWRAIKPYYGKWWLHILLFLATKGIGNAVYVILCLRGDKTRCVYVRHIKD